MEITEYVTPIQKKILFEFFANHPNLNAGLISRSFLRNMPNEIWEEIAEKLNSSSGAVKTWKQWRNYMQRMKDKNNYKTVKKGITSIQKKIIIEFIANLPNLNASRYSRSFTRNIPKELWEEIAAKLNSSSGAVKTWTQWRKYTLWKLVEKKGTDITSIQKKILIEFIANHPNLRSCTPIMAKKLWEEIAAKLNSSPGTLKSGSQWRETWKYFINPRRKNKNSHGFETKREPKRDKESLSASISGESLPASFDIDECLNFILQDSEEEIEITPSNSTIETIATKTTQSLYESYSLQPETLAKQSEELTKIQTQYYKEKIKILREKQALDKDIKIRTVIALETIAKATKGK